jgi:hypothetical protein
MTTRYLDRIFWLAFFVAVLWLGWYFWDSSVWDECRTEGHSFAYCFDLIG